MTYTQRDYAECYDRPVMALLDPRLWVPLFARLKELHVKRSKSGLEFSLKGKTSEGQWVRIGARLTAPSMTELGQAMNRAVATLIQGVAA